MPAEKMPRKVERVDKHASAGVARPRGPGTRKEDWIGNELRRVYDEALKEDIPPEMIALLGLLDREKDE